MTGLTKQKKEKIEGKNIEENVCCKKRTKNDERKEKQRRKPYEE